MRILIANVLLVGRPGAPSGEWVLVDTGTTRNGAQIRRAAARRFDKGSRPAAIILTHGHFDHVGAVAELSKGWDVPVYAHKQEIPYLTGQADYLPPDPGVGGGLMSLLSPLYPRRAIDLGDRVQPLPENGEVPGLAGWRWLHTPGHTPGHISLFRESDRVLIAGDAFTTVQQESFLAVMTQRQELHGPPRYFTPDWQGARASVQALAALRPAVAATGHGVPMRGERLARELETLAREFDRLAVPPRGRYVKRPVREAYDWHEPAEEPAEERIRPR
ncbi:MAG: MBL fold metallo-hydrolase [Bacillota bacterium]